MRATDNLKVSKNMNSLSESPCSIIGMRVYYIYTLYHLIGNQGKIGQFRRFYLILKFSNLSPNNCALPSRDVVYMFDGPVSKVPRLALTATRGVSCLFEQI